MLKNEIYYKSFGIRRPTQLITGTLHDLSKLETVKDSIYVHDDTKNNELFVPMFLWMDYNKRVPVYAPNPGDKDIRERVLNIKYKEYIRDLKKDKRYRYVDRFTVSPPSNLPVIIDSGFVNKTIRIQDTKYKDQRLWEAVRRYTVSSINDLSYINRTYYVFLRPEGEAFSPVDMDILAKKDNDNSLFLKRVNNDWTRTLIDIYRYLHPDLKEKSIYNNLSKDVIGNIIFVVYNDRHFSLLSLRNLINWTVSDFKYIRKALPYYFFRIGEDYYMEEKDTDDEEKTDPDKLLSEGLKLLNSAMSAVANINSRSINEIVDSPTTTDKAIEEELNKQLADKIITRTTYNRYMRALEQRKKLKNPFNKKESIDEYIQSKPDIEITQEEMELPVKDIVPDQSMAKDVVGTIDKKYLKEVYHREVIESITAIERAGVIVEDYSIDREESLTGDVEIHKVKIRPLNGKPSEIKIRLPVIDDEGEMKMDGNIYKLRKQRTDVPIRKIAPARVALTSYYGKVLVDRSSYNRERYGYWLYRRLLKIYEEENSRIKIMKTMDVLRNVEGLPLYYTDLSRYISEITIDNYKLIFNYDRRESFTGFKASDVEKKGYVLVGKRAGKPVLMDKYGKLYVDDVVTSIEEMLSIDTRKAPVPAAHMNLIGDRTPIGIVLCKLLGFSGLLKYLGVSYYELPVKTRLEDPENEWAIVFSDTKLVFKRDVSKETLILSGLNDYKDILKGLTREDMDNQSTYTNFLNVSRLKEIENLDSLYIDPITLSILKRMNEPITFSGLLIRSAELLTYDYHSYVQDMDEMVIRGYEKIPGFIYKELITAIKQQKRKNVFGNAKVEISPYSVWNSIREDAMILPDLNPIGTLKISEEITYLGVGGRSRETMTEDSRKFHTSDLGVISESTKDSKDVGITMSLTANPNINNYRGIKSAQFDVKRQGAGSVLSTSGMLAPAIDQDDPKRAAFTSIQNTHTLPVSGQEQAMFRTGYDYVLPYRVGKKYVLVAEQDGKVTGLTKTKMTIEYKDNTTSSYRIGKWYSREEAGVVYIHELVPNVEKGKKFKKGDILYYDSGYFEKDWLYDNAIVYKNATLLKTALMEMDQTYEDSSAMTKAGTKKLVTKSSKVHVFRIPYNATISDMVEVGQKIKSGDPLFIMGHASISDDLDEEAKQALRDLTTSSPSSKYTGIVGRIEAYYNGDIEDMSDSIKKIAEESNKMFSKELGKKVDGDTKGTVLVNGTPIHKNEIVIKIYVDVEEPYGLGDKSVFGNQLKTTTGEVFTYDIKTESGEDVDAVFGERSVYARIVLSPFIMGTTNTLLLEIAKKAVNDYFE